ncbi:MAG: hypothetical protein WCK13_01000 [Ignavibacteriota bacterium]|nr:outer membrane beta-barrel protein [Ignavibacteriota bacterium]
MKKLFAILFLVFNTVISAYSQPVLKINTDKFIQRFSIGAGLGTLIPVENYKMVKGNKLLVDLTLRYKFSNEFSSGFDINFEDDNSAAVSYLNFDARYSYLNYRNTLIPYFEIGIGAYYGKELLAKDEVFMYYSETKSYFGGSVGTGLDLKLSPYAALDLNFKYHSFTFNEPLHFFTVLACIRFNL